MNKPASTKKGKGAWINCGIDKEVRVDLPAPAGTRVTGKFLYEKVFVKLVVQKVLLF